MASGAALRISRWLDHLPPWLAWGAIVSTDAYTPLELAGMALPLGLAALSEWRRWDLARWRRPLEITALLALTIQAWARIGLVPTTVNTLFLLCGIRLALPRGFPQRRQILLMGFLLFLTTSVATTELPFAFWALAFMVGGGIVLMQLAWEPSATLRPGPLRHPPYWKVFQWSGAVALLAGLAFVTMPRLTLALHPFPWGIPGLSTAHAGLSDRLSLGGKGPLMPNSDVALRILPREKPSNGSPPDSSALELLKGIALEDVDGQRWNPTVETPQRRFQDFENEGAHRGECIYDFYVAPNPRGIIPLPAGTLRLLPVPGASLRSGPGGSVRWAYPPARTLLLSVTWSPQVRQEAPPIGHRRSLLMSTGKGTEAALAWSRRVVPEEVPSKELASRLSAALQQYRYTLDNPSGNASNPLEDFLERSRAGHCEYFASALAFMLRHRGIPARVVNGYRLGPWIAAGEYWIVTQNEAHSWVEFYDDLSQTWMTADPTPSAPPGLLEGPSFWAATQRWMDSLRFRWDRYVVRFSDADQVAGLEWIREKTSSLMDLHLDSWLARMLAIAAAFAMVFRIMRTWHPWWLRWLRPKAQTPQGILALKPLLRKTRKELPHRPGETARTWLSRLMALKPDRADSLAQLADETDRVGYGGAQDRRLKALVKAELKAWRS